MHTGKQAGILHMDHGIAYHSFRRKTSRPLPPAKSYISCHIFSTMTAILGTVIITSAQFRLFNSLPACARFFVERDGLPSHAYLHHHDTLGAQLRATQTYRDNHKHKADRSRWINAT